MFPYLVCFLYFPRLFHFLTHFGPADVRAIHRPDKALAMPLLKTVVGRYLAMKEKAPLLTSANTQSASNKNAATKPQVAKLIDVINKNKPVHLYTTICMEMGENIATVTTNIYYSNYGNLIGLQNLMNE